MVWGGGEWSCGSHLENSRGNNQKQLSRVLREGSLFQVTPWRNLFKKGEAAWPWGSLDRWPVVTHLQTCLAPTQWRCACISALCKGAPHLFAGNHLKIEKFHLKSHFSFLLGKMSLSGNSESTTHFSIIAWRVTASLDLGVYSTDGQLPTVPPTLRWQLNLFQSLASWPQWAYKGQGRADWRT